MQTILEYGIEIITAIQGWGIWLKAPMEFFSFLGTEQFYLLALPAIYWCIDSRLGLRIAVILLAGSSINDTLKLCLHGPRPYWYSPAVHGHAAETSFGAPSGHAQNAVGVWGMLAAGLRRGWAWGAAGALMFLIGFSRLFLGVHFPHDVLLGWLAGGLLLALVLALWSPAAAWLERRTTGQQILAGLAFSLLLILPGLLVQAWLTGHWSLPATWLQNAAAAIPDGEAPDPLSLDGLVSNAGTIFGMAAGLAIFARGGGFSMRAPAWKLILRLALGVAGVLAIRFGLGAIFPGGDGLLPALLRYLRYALIGAWVSLGAPWLFLRLKLAERTAPGRSRAGRRDS